MIKNFNQWLQPENWFNLCETWGTLLFLAVFPCLIFAWVCGLCLAPTDVQQGEVYRIIYVHVPAAAMSLGIYAVLGVCAICFLVTRVVMFDYLALSMSKVGALFTLLSLVTGGIWGMPTWGTWWIWDARLTAQFVLLVIYLSYIAVRQGVRPERLARIYASVVAMIGLIDLPIIHFSVQWWSTLHQPPTLFKLAKPSIDPEMLWALIICLMTYGLIALLLVLLTLREDLLQHCRQKQWVKSRQSS